MLIGSAALDFEGSTQYSSFVSNGVQSTTSDGWISKSNHLTEDARTPGRYVVHFQAELTNSLKGKAIGYEVKWRAEGGAWAVLHDTRGGVSVDSEYQARSGFREISLLTNAKVEVEVSFGQTVDGGTASIKNSNVYVFKVGELIP